MYLQWLSPDAPLPEDSNNLGRVAQLAEHSTLNRQVEGSIPSASTILFKQNQQLMRRPILSESPFWV